MSDGKFDMLLAKRLDLRFEIKALQDKLAGLEIAIAFLDPENAESPEECEKVSIKTTLLELLGEAGAKGLNSQIAIQKASRRGIRLDRGSVSSMLSRLKRQGLVTYDGQRYRLNGCELTDTA